jgi:TRAP-type C4-dicarboxylate transport system substrate-binding protein
MKPSPSISNIFKINVRYLFVWILTAIVVGLSPGIFATEVPANDVSAADRPAAELPATELNVVGGLSTRLSFADVEQPFWIKSLPERSNGRVTAQIKGFDELGIKGPELLRLMSQGVIEFGVIPLAYFQSDIPLFESLDIAGLVTDFQLARSSAQALKPVLSQYFSSKHQSKLLGVSPYLPQVLFCNGEVRSLLDLRGRTIRTVTRSQGELIEALGAKSVNMPLQEVLSALSNKSISCAVASSFAGYQAKLFRAATHLFALPIGWNQEVHAVNQKTWDKLSPELQTFLETSIESLIDELWLFSERLTKIGYDCNTGSKDCLNIPRGRMILVSPTQADLATVKRLATQKVLPQWASRCSDTCVTDYNDTIGKLLKINVKK